MWARKCAVSYGACDERLQTGVSREREKGWNANLEYRGAKKCAIAKDMIRSSTFRQDIAMGIDLTLLHGKVQASPGGTGLASCLEWSTASAVSNEDSTDI